ncbi:MAG: extracellular solute-binding protein [Butyrivibrio sp.]
MEKRIYKAVSYVLTMVMIAIFIVSTGEKTEAAEPVTVLRVSNWEEYIDQGDWDEEELIDLESCNILGENSLIEDFEDWYYETYNERVRVEYSTFGTNEDLYSQLTLGDVYDLICPSDYLIMKLMKEGKLQPLSEGFFDEANENNYYIKGVSPFIKQTFDDNTINGESWSRYAAGYMWGVTGIVYNPEEVDREAASTWEILNNADFKRQVTIKDNVRDAYFPALGILFKNKLLDSNFRNGEQYREELLALMNSTDENTVEAAELLLKEIKENVYSFETDSGKADMVTGKVVANLQWSGDAVYTMDQAEEDGVLLEWAVPEECTNLWFDGWVMLKAGIEDDAKKQHAAEAFINFLSKPESAVRNMYYIGYTSCIAGGDDSLIYEYIEWNYGAEEEEEDTELYPLGYFFSGDDEDSDYILTTSTEQTRRQLSAQYPLGNEIQRSAVMLSFDDDAYARINQMWINIRCFNLGSFSARTWIIIGTTVVVLAALAALYLFRHRIFRPKVKKGYHMVE